MKFFKFIAFVIGSFSMIFGLNSCKKDEDKNECCTATMTYYGITTTQEACEDGSYTFKMGTYSYSGSWKDDYDSWTAVKDTMVNNYDATCK